MFEATLEHCNERDWLHDRPTATIDFAMIGVGWWVREEAIPAVADSEFCRTSVVVSGSKEKAQELVESTDTVERGLTYEEFHDGVAADTYDAVYVCTPNALHLSHVRAAVGLGKDVLCEKPMEATVERARDLVSAAEESDSTLMIAYRMQTEPIVRRARELLQAGAIGEPVAIHSDICARLLEINPDPDQWRLDEDLAGGCALMDLGIYPLNTARFVLEADPIAVTGTTMSEHDPFADVDEHVWFELEFPGETTAQCTASHNAYGTSSLRIVGREGLIELSELYHPWADRSMTIELDGDRASYDVGDVNQMTEEFDYFASRLLTETEPVPDGRHGLRDMQIMDRIYEAAESGQRTLVPE